MQTRICVLALAMGFLCASLDNALLAKAPNPQSGSKLNPIGQEGSSTRGQGLSGFGIRQSQQPDQKTNGRKLPHRNSLETRLRFSWGSGASHAWHGTIEIDNGDFENSATIGLSFDASGAIKSTRKKIEISHLVPTNYSGFDIDVRGKRDSQITIELYPSDHTEQKFKQILKLGDLIDDPSSVALDSQQNVLTIARAAGDRLPIEIQRDHLIFATNEQFLLNLRANLTQIKSRTARCKLQVVPARKKAPVHWDSVREFELDANGSSLQQAIKFDVPSSEGVYDLQITLEPNWYQQPFAAKRQVISRSIQFVVLNSKSPLQPQQPSWRQIATIDPTVEQQKGILQWPQLSRTSNQARTTLGNDRRATVNVAGHSSPMVQLGPSGWQAIPIKVGRTGEPHVLDIEFLAEDSTALGLSILQPDANGQIPLHGFDSGVYVPNTIATDPSGKTTAKVQRHRLTFWPEHPTPYLLVANRSPSSAATFGTIRVLTGPKQLPFKSDLQRSGPPHPKGQSSTLSPELDPANQDNRRLMAFFETPLFADRFGATKRLDETVAQPLDDWQTFYDGAQRFVQHLKANQYGGAFVTVVSDGSSLYPSSLLAPSPKFDSGVFFSTGQDPMRKDVLELLFRMFQREDLQLVPTLAFSHPLPEIEALRSPDGLANDFELLDYRETRGVVATSNNLPIYSPLDLRVQGSVNHVVEEISQRYRSHPAFKGIALICRPDTYTMIPGRQWCYDRTTIQRFLQSEFSDPGELGSDWNKIREMLFQSKQDEWVTWRGRQMTAFYRQLQNTIRQSVPQAQLFLAPVDIFRNEEISSALAPNLNVSADFSKVMKFLGFEPELTQDDPQGGPGVVLLKPQRLAPDTQLAAQRVEMNLETSDRFKDYFRDASYQGGLFTHRSTWAHFAQLEKQSPFGEQRSPLMRLQPMTPAGQWNRKRFIESLKAADTKILVDGGTGIATGQDQAIAELVSVFSKLPDQEFDRVVANPSATLQNVPATNGESRRPFIQASSRKIIPTDSPGPIVVRQLNRSTERYFYAINSAAWPIELTLKIDSTVSADRLHSLSSARFEVDNADDGRRLRVSLPPFSIAGARIESANRAGGPSRQAAVLGYSYKQMAGIDEPLRKHLYLLQSKLIKSTKVQPTELLGNPGFSFEGAPNFNYWDSSDTKGTNVKLMANGGFKTPGQPRSKGSDTTDAACLKLISEGETVWVRSNEFPVPATGRLSVSVWLRTDDPNVQPPLRLAIEGQAANSNYYRYGSIGSLSPSADANQVGKQWKRFAVHFDDMPAEGLTRLRVGFDLMGAGNIEVDNVQLYDRWFDENDSKAMTQMLAGAGPLLEKTETLDQCRRMLEGYWPQFLNQHFNEHETSRELTAGIEATPDNQALGDYSVPNSSIYEQEVPAFPNESQFEIPSDRRDRKGTMFKRFRNWGQPRGRNR